jgi:hypothetical protein
MGDKRSPNSTVNQLGTSGQPGGDFLQVHGFPFSARRQILDEVQTAADAIGARLSPSPERAPVADMFPGLNAALEMKALADATILQLKKPAAAPFIAHELPTDLAKHHEGTIEP